MRLYRGMPLEEIKRLKRPRILFPNEHGAWGIFATAFLTGWLAAPELSWRPLLILPAAFGAFLARYPVGIYLKKRRVARALKIDLSREKVSFAIYAALTAVVAFPLFYPLGWWWLLIFGVLSSAALALNLWAVIRRKERSFFVEAAATLGLTFLAPAASYAAILRFDWQPVAVWAVLALFYTWRITEVRRRVSRKKQEPVDLKALGKRELLYSFVFLLATVLVVRLIFHYLGGDALKGAAGETAGRSLCHFWNYCR